jgi:hypothetical protein
LGSQIDLVGATPLPCDVLNNTLPQFVFAPGLGTLGFPASRLLDGLWQAGHVTDRAHGRLHLEVSAFQPCLGRADGQQVDVVATPGGLRFAEREVILDNSLIPNSIIDSI